MPPFSPSWTWISLVRRLFAFAPPLFGFWTSVPPSNPTLMNLLKSHFFKSTFLVGLSTLLFLNWPILSFILIPTVGITSILSSEDIILVSWTGMFFSCAVESDDIFCSSARFWGAAGLLVLVWWAVVNIDAKVLPGMLLKTELLFSRPPRFLINLFSSGFLVLDCLRSNLALFNDLLLSPYFSSSSSPCVHCQLCLIIFVLGT